MNDYKLIKYNESKELPKAYLASAAALYCYIWAEAPWNESWTLEEAQKELLAIFNRNDSVLILCIENNKTIGFVGGGIAKTESLNIENEFINQLGGDEVFYIDEIGLDKNQRGKGIGQRLLREIVEKARSNNPRLPIILHTDVKAEAARKLYERVGFKETVYYHPEDKNHTYWTWTD